MSSSVRPPFDPEMAAVIAAFSGPPPPEIPTPENVAERRNAINAMRAGDIKAVYETPGLYISKETCPGPQGDVPLIIIRPASDKDAPPAMPRPCLVYLHGGGMYLGDPLMGFDPRVVLGLGAVVVTVDYRLAPEHQDLVLVEDCFAALRWVAAQAARLAIDPARLMVGGGSAGGGLAAGTALLARDRGGPPLCGMLLQCPMLDDCNDSLSCRQFSDAGTYTARQNAFAWRCVLGERAGGPGTSPYVAAARATDLSGLPEAWIDAGSAEPFRDEAVGFASRMWAAGCQAELHVWPGATHGFRLFCPNADLSHVAGDVVFAWLRRKLVKIESKSQTTD